MASHLTAAILLISATSGAADRNAFDCAMRNFAVEFANTLQPWRPAASFTQLADALNGSPEKAPGCTVQSKSEYGVEGGSRFREAPIPEAGQTFYVSPTGSDSNPGTPESPFATVEFALTTTRKNPGFNTVILRAGEYFLAAPLQLTAADNGLTIQSFPGEEAWLTGAKPLTGLTWAPFNVTTQPTWIVAQNANAIYGQDPNPNVFYNATYPTWQGCEAACKANNSATGGAECKVWTWHDANQSGYELKCFFRYDGRWSIVGEDGHVSGHLAPAMNVWSASLAGQGVASIPGLRVGGRRATRARFPNADPETDGFMPPAVFRANWTPQQAKRAPDVQIDLPASALLRNTTVSAFQVFTAGIGGTCARFSPPAGYWCSEKVQGGGSVIYYVPIAMDATKAVLPNSPYKDPTTAIVQTWRPGHWASWMYQVGSATYNDATNTTNFTFSSGGFQGSRGEDQGEDSYIENVFEELDSPGEYFYNEKTQVLYFWFNSTTPNTPPPNDGSLKVTSTKGLVSMIGTAAAPVTDVSLVGLGFRDTAYTYMDPHGIPSGGDWTLERSAVVFLEGTMHATVTGCVFERVDGNAIMMSAYNRNGSITHNEFAWIGATAVAMWGNTDGGDARLPSGYGFDGSAGLQPRHNVIGWNLCRELGVWEKQSSFYTQFKSSENTIVGNIIFNGPRAHVNFNDGFRGGAVMEHNLLVNSCRESGDHGPFNSWDRDPYIFDINGKPSTVKMYDIIRNNFVLANFDTLGAIDNDDGSNYYMITDNFFVYSGGQKLDFEGHDSTWSGNVLAYLNTYASHNGYSGQIGTPGNGMLDGHEAQFTNNKVVLQQDDKFVNPICSGRGKTVYANNTVYSPNGAVQECGEPLKSWQAKGNDPGTVNMPYYTGMDDDLIAWARAVLLS